MRQRAQPIGGGQSTIRILHVFPSTAYAYAPWAIDMINGLCAEQERRGHHVRVVSTVLDLPAESLENARHSDLVEYFPVDKSFQRIGIRILRRALVSSALARDLRRTIDGFDVVHIHYVFSFPSLVAAAICRRRGVPYIVSLHGNLDPYMHAKRNRFLKDAYLLAFGRRALNKAAAIHLISEGERDMVKAFGLTSRQVVIDLGLDALKFRSEEKGKFRAAYPEWGSQKVVMYLGRLAYSKGLDLLADAFRILAADDPEIHLVLVGPDDHGYGEAIRQILRRESLVDRVTVTGRVSEEAKISALMDANVFAFPSYSEAFGLAMVEAMACGLPVVLTERAALAREMESLGAALVVKSDAPALAAGLNTLLRDPDLCQRIASTARTLVATRFSWPVVTTQFLNLYETCISARHSDGTLRRQSA